MRGTGEEALLPTHTVTTVLSAILRLPVLVRAAATVGEPGRAEAVSFCGADGVVQVAACATGGVGGIARFVAAGERAVWEVARLGVGEKGSAR